MTTTTTPMNTTPTQLLLTDREIELVDCEDSSSRIPKEEAYFCESNGCYYKHQDSLVECVDTGDTVPTDDAYFCPLKNKYYKSDLGFVFFNEKGNDNHCKSSATYVHEDNLPRQAFQDDRNDLYYDANHWTKVSVEGETVCYEAHSDELYYWSDEEYHWESEPEQSDEMFQYGRDTQVDPTRRGVSIEIEVNALDEDDGINFACEVVHDQKIVDRTVQDGSLDSENYGLEVVVGWKPMEEVEDVVRKVSEAFATYGFEGHNAGTGYGIHISISRKGWGISDQVAGLMAGLVDNNKEIFQILAQRKGHSTYCPYGYFDTSMATHSEKVGNRAKYRAISFRNDDRIEFRLFRSNTRMDRIMKNVQVVESIVDFAQSIIDCPPFSNGAGIIPSANTYLEFVQHRHETLGSYSYLNKFLLERGLIKPIPVLNEVDVYEMAHVDDTEAHDDAREARSMARVARIRLEMATA